MAVPVIAGPHLKLPCPPISAPYDGSGWVLSRGREKIRGGGRQRWETPPDRDCLLLLGFAQNRKRWVWAGRSGTKWELGHESESECGQPLQHHNTHLWLLCAKTLGTFPYSFNGLGENAEPLGSLFSLLIHLGGSIMCFRCEETSLSSINCLIWGKDMIWDPVSEHLK